MTAANREMARGEAEWFTGGPGGTARCWFLCFPHAGAGAAGYMAWSRLLPPGVGLRVAQLPGREARFREPAHRDVHALTRELMPSVEALATRPIALFGHSLGALVAFEVAREMERAGLPQPLHLYVSGRHAPHLPLRRRATWNLDDGALIATLRELGGTPDAVLADPELFSLFVPVLRADLQMNEGYAHRPGGRLAVPITAFAAAGDPRAAPDEVAAWAQHTTGRFAFVQLEGGHFALLSQPHLVTDRVLARAKDGI